MHGHMNVKKIWSHYGNWAIVVPMERGASWKQFHFNLGYFNTDLLSLQQFVLMVPLGDTLLGLV